MPKDPVYKDPRHPTYVGSYKDYAGKKDTTGLYPNKASIGSLPLLRGNADKSQD